METSKFRCLLATKDSSQLLNLTALANSDLAPRKKKSECPISLHEFLSSVLQQTGKTKKPNMPYQILNEHGFYF